jgi:hypothetical protein
VSNFIIACLSSFSLVDLTFRNGNQTLWVFCNASGGKAEPDMAHAIWNEAQTNRRASQIGHHVWRKIIDFFREWEYRRGVFRNG